MLNSMIYHQIKSKPYVYAYIDKVEYEQEDLLSKSRVNDGMKSASSMSETALNIHT